MKLENQVCSLELAKRLRELGVKQESLFVYWTRNSNKLSILDNGSIYAVSGSDFTLLADQDFYVSAFTVAELGEMLPIYTKTYKLSDCFRCEEEGTDCEDDLFFGAETEADARAETLVYLLENNLIEKR